MGHSPAASTADFTESQKNQITSIATAQLSNLQSDSPIYAAMQSIVTDQRTQGIDMVNSQYKTMAPQLAESVQNVELNQSRPPLWVQSITENATDNINTKLTGYFTAFPEQCQIARSAPPTCVSMTYKSNSIPFQCSGNSCTLQMGDKVLYIGGDMVVGNQLQVESLSGMCNSISVATRSPS